MKHIRNTSPILVDLSNDTEDYKLVKLFGSSFNEFENNDVKGILSDISYSFIQKTLLNTIYKVDLTRLHIQSTDKKKKLSPNFSETKLKELVINLFCADINGQSIMIPIIVKSYFDKKQNQKDIVDINYPINLDDKTELVFKLPPKSKLTATFFPYKITKLSGTSYYGYSGLISSIKDIKHNFSTILVNKLNEAKELKDKLDNYKNSEFVFSSQYFDNSVDYALNTIHDIPSDLYRNMVNLYMHLDYFIIGAKKEIEQFSLNVKNNKSKKTNSETIDFVSSKIDNKKTLSNKAVKTKKPIKK